MILRNNQTTIWKTNTAPSGKRVYFEGHPAFLLENSGTFLVDDAARTVTYAPTATERRTYTPATFSATAPQLVELVRDVGSTGVSVSASASVSASVSE